MRHACPVSASVRAPLAVAALTIALAGAFQPIAAVAAEASSTAPLWLVPENEPTLPAPRGRPLPTPRFDRKDEAAALEAIQVALTQVGDGSSYVWYRHGGRLSGVIQPTQSFKDPLGRVCRHLVVTLSAEGRSARTDAIACRQFHGGWIVDG
jgi:hypothetical protein